MSKKKSERMSWLDYETETPLIEKYAKKADSFLEAMADGKIDESELKAQEKRVVKLMKDIEPELKGELHEKVTKLLCELTVYDLMQFAHSLSDNRPPTKFRG